VEELSDFSMTLTPRDKRLTRCLSLLLSSDVFVIATTRSFSMCDPSLTVHFAKTFYLHPPDLNGRMALLLSLPADAHGGLIDQFRCSRSLDLLKEYAGLQPSELILAGSFEKANAFDKVAGANVVLAKLQFLILKPLTDPHVFRQIGAKPPRGVLLTGPSGCGKSLIARSIGGASKVSFFDISAVEVIAKEVGASERLLHGFFEQARAASPSILLFDDIDAIAPRRTFETSAAGDRLLTTLLVEMDGLAGRDDGVVVIATTNRLSVLDPAVTRPGRFDFVITIPLPDAKAREEIFDLYTRGVGIEDRERAREIVVKATEGLTGANIEGIIREAAMVALRMDMDTQEIAIDAFREALESSHKPVKAPPVARRVQLAGKRGRKL
jgi:SpoVK/Ycf46/Vps4 family AAA+-type ATPase